MLVEVRAEGVSAFMLAKVSDRDIEDVRAMYLEKELKPKDAIDLWHHIPNVTPIDARDILRPVEPHECTEDVGAGLVSKIIDVEGTKSIPRWEWDQIFALCS